MAQQAFGDIFYVQTPQIDRVSNLLYNQQLQRQQQVENETKQFDELMKKEFAGVRSADIQDISQRWNTYKNLKKQLLSNRDIQKDPAKFIELQKAANTELSSLQKDITQSKEYKKTLDDMIKDRMIRPESYDDNAGSMLSLAMQTPLSKLRQFPTGLKDEKDTEITLDFTNPDTFRYKGTDYDPFPDLDKLKGSRITREVGTGAVSPTSTEDRFEVFEFYERSPLEYKNRFKSMLAGDRKAQKFYLAQLENTPPEEIQKVNEQYKALPKETFEKLGLKKDELSYDKATDKADVAATYMAQKYALENAPFISKFKKEEFRENKERKRLLDFEDWKKKNSITSSQAMQRARTVAAGKGEQPAYSGNAIDEFGSVSPISAETGIIENGFVRDKDGKAVANARIFVPKSQVPSTIYSALKAVGAPENILLANEGFTAIVKNGVIEGLEAPYLGLINRQAIENAQLKLNTEPQKGKQMQFGSQKPQQAAPKTNKPLTLAERMKAAQKGK